MEAISCVPTQSGGRHKQHEWISIVLLLAQQVRCAWRL